MTTTNDNLLSQKSVLLFTDTSIDLTLVREVVEKTGYVVESSTYEGQLIASNGQEAVLVLLAFQVEEMVALCTQLKANYNIPIIVVVPQIDEALKARIFMAGATDYLVPSMLPAEIQARLTSYLTIQALNDQITALQLAYTSLEQSNTTLHQQNTEKDEFFAIVAHDLKSPFMPLLGASEFMAEMAEMLKPTDVKEMSLSIYRSAKGLYKLLENLLQWSRLQRGKLEYQADSFDLAGLVERNIQLLHHEADRKGINLSNQVDPTLAAYADEEMVDTILYNLIANGIKYTHKGGLVMVESHRLSSTELSLKIIDTGVGINQEDMTRLFNLNEHYTTPGTDHETGMGLGLIISQQMLEKNDGMLQIRSEVGEGTTVEVTLPAGNTSVHPTYTLADRNTTSVDSPTIITIDSLTPPPDITMHVLFDFAMAGDMEGIREQAVQIGQMDDTLKPFATMLQQLAAGYQEQEILELVEHFLS